MIRKITILKEIGKFSSFTQEKEFKYGQDGQNCNIIFGSGIDEAMNDEVEITIIATGFDGKNDLVQNNDRAKEEADAFGGFNTKSLFGAQVSQPNITPQPQQNLYAQRPEEPTITKAENSSIYKVEDADIPPFLKKLRKDRW